MTTVNCGLRIAECGLKTRGRLYFFASSAALPGVGEATATTSASWGMFAYEAT